MEEPNIPKYRWITYLASGLLVYFILSVCIFSVTIAFLFRKDFFITSPPPADPKMTIVPTPQILVHIPANKKIIKFDDFSSFDGNKGKNWELYYRNGKIEIIDGKLVLQSNAPDYSIIGHNQELIPTSDTYYVQVDLMTDIDVNRPYGMVFGMNSQLDTYYLFEIIPQSNQFSLYKHSSSKWEELIPFSYSDMKLYPEANTLSVYFENGEIELFINGNSITTFKDEQPYHYSGIGIFASDSSYRLIADNFFAYSEK